jgi:hypothetical protein
MVQDELLQILLQMGTINEEKAEAIQQREQLRQMILGKFLKDFGKNKKAKDVIEEIVTLDHCTITMVTK